MNNDLSEWYQGFHKQRRKSGTINSRERIEWIVRSVGSSQRICELGCRYGDILELFRGRSLTGIEIDREAAEKCRARLGCECIEADLNQTLPLSDEQFDAVILTEVLEHLPYPQITLRECRRVLKSGGCLVGSVPHAYHIRSRLRFLFGGEIDHDESHVRFFSETSLEAELRRFFSSVEVVAVEGRFSHLLPRLTANRLLFRAIK